MKTKKTTIIILSLLITCFLCQIAYAGDSKANKPISGNIVIENAKNGDPEAIAILQNLDCFDPAKLDDITGGKPIYLTEENPTKTINFPDGSAIVYGINNTNSISNNIITTMSTSRIESEFKDYYYLGTPIAGITIYADVTYYSRNLVIINETWAEAWSIGTVSGVGSSIITNNASSVKCEGHGHYDCNVPPWSETMNIHMVIDSAGAVYSY